MLRVASDFSEVVYGQSVHDASVPGALVKLGSFEGKRLGVRNDTSFRGSNTAMLRDNAFKSRIVKPCPPKLFDALQRAVTQASATAVTGTPTAERATPAKPEPSAQAGPDLPPEDK